MATNAIYTRIANLAASSNGKRRVMEFHLDDNHDVLNTAIELLAVAVFETGGVIYPGTVSLSGTTFSVDSTHVALAVNKATAVAISGVTLDVSTVPDGYHRLAISTTAQTTDRSYIDPDTGETIVHSMATGIGNLTVVQGDTTNYPALNGSYAPLVKFQMSSGSVASWSMDNDYIAKLWAKPRISAGATASRPASPETGESYFDTDLGKPIWWNGTAWVDATGTAV